MHTTAIRDRLAVAAVPLLGALLGLSAPAGAATQQPLELYANGAGSVAGSAYRLRGMVLGQGTPVGASRSAGYGGWPSSAYAMRANVNNAPQLAAGGTLQPSVIAEDAFDNDGDRIGALLAAGPAWRDVDRGAERGLAITAVEARNGTWQYRLTDGEPWLALDAVADDHALLVGSGARLRFVPDADYFGSDTGGLVARGWDRTQGSVGGYADVAGAGGTSAFSRTEVAVAAIDVAAVNDGPAAAPLTLTVFEDTAKEAVLGGSDIDSPSLDYLITRQPSRGQVELLDTAGAFRYTPDGDQTGSDSFAYRVSDGALTSGEATVSIFINPINDAPHLAAIADQATDSGVALSGVPVTVTDIDSLASELSFSVASDNPTLLPATSVVVSGSGYQRTLSLLPSAGRSGSARVTVSVSDGGGSDETSFLLTVREADLPPLTASDDEGGGFDSRRLVLSGDGLTIQASGGSGSYSAAIVSQPAGTSGELLEGEGGSYRFVAPTTGAFAGTYVIRLRDEHTGESVDIAVYVPLAVRTAPNSVLNGAGGTVTVRGGAAGDRLALAVLAADGTVDDEGALASVSEYATASAAEADGNPATATFTAAAGSDFRQFRIRAEDLTQSALLAVNSALIHGVPAATYCARVAAGTGAAIAGAVVQAADGTRTVTGADGTFELRLPEPAYGDQELTVNADGYLARTVAGADYRDDCDKLLSLAMASGTLSGTVDGIGSGERVSLYAYYRTGDEWFADGPYWVTGDGAATAFTLALRSDVTYYRVVAEAAGYVSAVASEPAGYVLGVDTVALVLERPTGYVAATGNDMLDALRLGAAAALTSGARITFSETSGDGDLCDHTVAAVTPIGEQRLPIASECLLGALSVEFEDDEAMTVTLYDAGRNAVFVIDYQPLESERRDGTRDAAESTVVSPYGFDETFATEVGSVGLRLPGDGIAAASADAVTLAVAEVEMLVTRNDAWARGSFGQVADVNLLLLDGTGGVLPVDAEHAGEVLQRLYVTLPFDTTRVRAEDFADGSVRIYQADDISAFERDEAVAIGTGAITRVDMLNGQVTFEVDHLSVFGISGNAVPVAFDDSLEVGAGESVQGRLVAVDEDGDALTYTLLEQPAYGSVAFDPQSGVFTYVSNAAAAVTDSFRFVASDGIADSNMAQIRISNLLDDVSVAGSGGGGALGFGLAALLLAVLVRLPRRAWTLLLLLFALTPARAEWYLGLGAGPSRTTADADALTSALSALGHVPNVTADTDDLGWQLYGGRRMDDWAVELGYVDLGSVRSQLRFSGAPTAQTRAAIGERHPFLVRGASLSALRFLPVASGAELFGKVGALAWRGEVDVPLPGGDVARDHDGIAGLLGFGVELRAPQSPLVVRAGGEGYRVDGDWQTLWSVAVSYRLR